MSNSIDITEEIVYLINTCSNDVYPTTIDETGIVPAIKCILSDYKDTIKALELAERIVESLEEDIRCLRDNLEDSDDIIDNLKSQLVECDNNW